ncbi:GntR family transcriptional regulator [Arthrobacter sp. I2-34]|uniref:GntR family transcriptional regulator n=1 Tax=Arthrobacter hankyongi TaxID=2904801 RepID=A0ABS9LDY5_9MICC|nr:GntR family transcriptional regulator [Arthrobacter hankyongi]MCG2624838.1 GntR family transcriptional regulator [Arthrobacter hankyongi]
MREEASRTRRDAVGQYLRDEILAGALPPGTPIKDAELARDLNLSITPVREAITQLISEGLIEALPNKRRRVTVVSDRNAVELVEVLGIVVAAVMERAATRLDAGQVEVMSEAVQRQRRLLAAGDIPGSRKAALDLLDVLVSAADHAELRSLSELVVYRALARLHLHPYPDLFETWTEGWEETIRYLGAGDADAAVQRVNKMFWIIAARLRDES